MRSKGSNGRICPHRLAVPEKIFALLACSIFSTAAGEGPPIPITAFSAYSLGSVTFCYWFAETSHKNAPQALFKPICVQYGFVFGRQPKNKFVSSAAGRPGFQGAALNDFWLLFFTEKYPPAGQAYK